MKHVSVAIAVLSLALLGASARGADDQTLYHRLGGTPGIEAIATTLIERVASDPKLGRSFEGTNRKRIEAHLAQQLCQIVGGPCHYEGDPMRAVHAGQKITETEFYGLVEALEDILTQRGVALEDRNQLLRRLASMKRDVVQVPPEKH